jgi:hypothetical protein
MSTRVQILPILLAATQQEFRWPCPQLVVTSDALEWMNSRARTSNFVSYFGSASCRYCRCCGLPINFDCGRGGSPIKLPVSPSELGRLVARVPFSRVVDFRVKKLLFEWR